MVAIIVLLGGLLFWQLPSWQRQAEVGAAYGARVGCSCRFIEGRDIASCEGDFEPGMGMVSLSENAGQRSITASVPLLASRTAVLDGASGCILEPK